MSQKHEERWWVLFVFTLHGLFRHGPQSEVDALLAEARMFRGQPRRAGLSPARTQTAPVPPISENGLSPISFAGPSSVKVIGSLA